LILSVVGLGGEILFVL